MRQQKTPNIAVRQRIREVAKIITRVQHFDHAVELKFLVRLGNSRNAKFQAD